jgi:hypothetical protein
LNEYQEKLKSLGFSARGKRSKVTPVTADEGPLRGEVVGKKREHWDDRVDAKVTRPVLTPNPNLVVKKKGEDGSLV